MKQFIKFKYRSKGFLYGNIMPYKVVSDEVLFLNRFGQWQLSYMTTDDVPPGVKWMDFI